MQTKLPNHKTLTLEQLQAKAADPSTPTRYRNLCIKAIQWIHEVRKMEALNQQYDDSIAQEAK